MGRNLARNDPDRYLSKLFSENYFYKRRVPTSVANLDSRAPVIRIALKTDDLVLARRKRDMLEAADDALWASYIEEDGATDPARRRYEAAVKRVEAFGFHFHSSQELRRASFDELQRRFREIDDSSTRDVDVPALLGAIDVPATTISQAFQMYCDEIVAPVLIAKSVPQRRQWRKVKQRAINKFVELNGDLAMVDITADHARRVYGYWLKRIAPQAKDGPATASASSGNRDIGNLRVLYEAYFRHMGEMDRQNPFAGFSFAIKIRRTRPTIPAEWIRDRVLAPGALAGMNDEARGILLIMIESGARPSEIANLDPVQFRLSHKVPHIAIEPRLDPENPREIKTESSKRLVPLVGVSLAAAQRHAAQGFPMYRDRETQLSAAINKYLRAHALLPTNAHTLYSFRHAYEDRMKEGDIDEELRRILMGHALDRPRYGIGGGLAWRRKQMLKIMLPFDPGIV